MKLTITFFSFFLTLICFSQTIRGKVIDTDTKKPLTSAFVYLVTPDNTKDTADIYYWRNYKYKIITQTRTDSFGKYSFTSLTPKVYNIVADYPMPKSEIGGYGIRQEIDSNINIKVKTNYLRNFYLMVTCPYDKTKNQRYCPVCKKNDLILPIQYGYPAPIYDSLGNMLDDPDKYFNAGCFKDAYCNPTRHCKRCNLNF